MVKSPFLVVQDFLSPLLCEQIVDDLNFIYPDKDQDGRPVKTMKSHDRSEDVIFQHLQNLIPKVESHYDIEYRGTTQMKFEWYPQACDGEKPHCENSEYMGKKWVRTKDRDLTGIIFFCEYQDHTPFDGDFDVYGGKVEFAQHQFGFNPNRGTLILFPSEPHFINGTTQIRAGDSFQVRFHMAATKPYLYDPSLFPGDYETWFEEIA
jgi:hypothetical protein